ncbi:MAG: DUF6428 family protein [Pirellulales bacterium]
MDSRQLSLLLEANPTAPLKFVLPGGEPVPDHFHVTEVGRVEKNFIDCGGTIRKLASCQLQLWTADDLHHRLKAGKLAAILKLADPVLKGQDLPVEVEYGVEYASTYSLANADIIFGTVQLQLVGKRTECLAPDRCGVGASADCCT